MRDTSCRYYDTAVVASIRLLDLDLYGGGTGVRELASRLFEASHELSSERPRAVRLVGKLEGQQAR